jgi:cobalt-zinc-cadmium resistance protein CzcA
VVIGGLITSTLLTLIILPILYAMAFAPRRMGSVIRNKALGILAVLGGVGALQAQTPFTEQDALARLLQNHPAVLAKDYKIQQQEALKGAARTYDPTDFFHNVTADPDLGVLGTSTFGIAQSFPSRKMTTAHQQYYDRKKAQSTAELSLTRQQLTQLVREYYQHLSYLNSKSAIYRHLDSVYQQFSTIAETRYQSGDAALAEQLAAKDKADKIRLELQTVGHEIAFDQEALGQLLGFDGPVKAVTEPFHRFIFSLADTAAISTSAISQWSLSGVAVADAQKTVEQAKLRPTASVGAYAQILGNGALYPGWQLGLSVPLFNKGRQKSIEAAGLNTRAAQAEYQNTLLEQRAALAHLLHEQEKYDILIQYYEEKGHALATELIRSAAVNYKAGEMDYAEFATYLEQATTIELAQLENLYGLNLAVIELKSLTGR